MGKGKVIIDIGKFEDFGILSGLVKVLNSINITKPTAIQFQAIPSLVKSSFHHLIAAQTGTGKTLTYTLPLFTQLKEQEAQNSQILTQSKSPRSVIVVPNKELARQTESVLNLFKHEVRLKTLSIYSGQKFEIEAKELESGVDILIGTPDRIDKHRVLNNLNFNSVNNLIVDESDTIIDAGFSRHLNIYCDELQKKAKFLFVSATFPLSLKRFIESRFSYEEGKPNYIKKIIDKDTHLNLAHLKHDFIQLQEFDKNPLFFKVLQDIDSNLGSAGCIVFCNSIQSARAVEHSINERGYSAVSLHGDVPNKHRLANIDKFINRAAKFLVCTDLGSRGLDFPFVSYVIQFDFPKTESDYIHRAGRAGRAGRPGTVIAFYRKSDLPMVNLFKQSFMKKKPLFIKSSAFSLKNKEGVVRPKMTDQEKLRTILNKTK